MAWARGSRLFIDEIPGKDRNRPGQLAKWLRMLGYYIAYINDADDDELVRIAVREGQALLTRDDRLSELVNGAQALRLY